MHDNGETTPEREASKFEIRLAQISRGSVPHDSNDERLFSRADG